MLRTRLSSAACVRMLRSETVRRVLFRQRVDQTDGAMWALIKSAGFRVARVARVRDPFHTQARGQFLSSPREHGWTLVPVTVSLSALAASTACLFVLGLVPFLYGVVAWLGRQYLDVPPNGGTLAVVVATLMLVLAAQFVLGRSRSVDDPEILLAFLEEVLQAEVMPAPVSGVGEPAARDASRGG
jgi:hypothetical protein